MKKHQTLCSAAMLAAALAMPAFALAGGLTTEYTLLAPLPAGIGNTTNLIEYIPGIFRLLIGFTVMLSVLYIIIGGIQYLSTDSWSGKGEGRKKIEDAIYGLILAIIAWLILYTINPTLVNFNFSIPNSGLGGTSIPNLPSGGSGSGTAQDYIASNSERLTNIEALGIANSNGWTICASGSCTNACTAHRAGCTSLEGIQQSTLNGVINLQQNCGAGCSRIAITGGTEPGNHAAGAMSHSGGYKIDIGTNNSDFNRYMIGQVRAQNQSAVSNVPSIREDVNYPVNIGGYRYMVRYEGNHWDITVIPGQ